MLEASPAPFAPLHRVQAFWLRWKGTILTLAIALMALVSTVWLAYQLWRLLWQPRPEGAIDLWQRHTELQEWFAGARVYGVRGTAVYPPASYAMFWPFMGWMGFTAARWTWALTSLACLGLLTRLVVRESGATTRLERVFVMLIPVSMYATGATIGNGQVTIHALTALLLGLLLACRPSGSWRQDLAAAALVVFGLIKVTIAAPFFWMVAFVPGRARPAILVLGGYTLLSVLGSMPQAGSTLELMNDWQEAGMRGVEYGSTREASSNLHTLIATEMKSTIVEAGQRGNPRTWLRAASLVALALLGAWTYWRRRSDPWPMLGVAAVVARFWTYHNWYDDLLILLPMIALFRIAKHDSRPSTCVMAGLFLAAAVPSMLAPGGRYLLPKPWVDVYASSQTLLWIAMAGFLLVSARRSGVGEGSHGRRPSPSRLG